ncbi:MAG: peptidase T [Ruminococcaceae bacterium]|jgi:tripeptide aminopeptidase|nr:peptidase T [Oscillospiraceae bacterium]
MDMMERFLKYVAVGTNSNPKSQTIPSTPEQKVLGAIIVEDMKAMGIQDAFMDEYGYVYGTVPGNCDAPTVGFIAHMDTVIDMPCENIKPRYVEYKGGDVVLNEEKGIVLTPLEKHVGHTLIVTDGTTLLGGDDKAGIVEILDMAQYFLDHPEVKHGTIKLGFTPDEEIGRGTLKFDVPGFGAVMAYTVDGGDPGAVSYENFNACAAKVEFNGTNTHPGGAKNKMLNSLWLGMEFHSMLPVNEAPQFTEGYEGFSHLNGMSGNVEHTLMEYIIRDHDKTLFEQKKARFEKIAAYMNEKYGEGTVVLTLKDSYYNMKEPVMEHPELIDIAYEAVTESGFKPYSQAARGGTDGAQLSYKGLPCPNLGTGGHNAHSRYEYVSVQEMHACRDILIAIAKKFAEKK